MFWATNSQPVMMLGDDAALMHKIDVTPRSKGVATCDLFVSGNNSKCGPSEERPTVSVI